MASTGPFYDVQSTVALVKTLTNAQLKDILRNEGLAVSGVKASLQIRILDYIERLREGGHIEKYDSMRKFIYHTAHRSIPSPTIQQPSSNQQYQQPSVSQSLPTQHRPSPLSMAVPSHAITPGRLIFKDSPFYTVLDQLTPTAECKVREHTRDSVELKVAFTPSMASKLQADPNLRVMVFCAADTGLNQYTKSDIAFPHQVELKTNLDEVKANLRGLKNKPGTTRPADITNYVRKKAGYQNTVVLTFALTQKRFFVLVNLVQRHPVDELVTELKRRKTISKEQVLREMRSKAEDTEIVATSSVMSLKCPLSHTRIAVPCRSIICTHNQCFDASSFLQLQEQAPQWLCPVCSKATSFESLQIDQYVDDILRLTPSDFEQVIIEPDGKWSHPNLEDIEKAGKATSATEDDELIEIKEPGISPIKQESFSAVNLTLQQTPLQSREPSATSSAVPTSINKRPAAQVIDLTGSDDDDDGEDDLPVRPTKRPALGEMGRSSLRQEYHDSYTSGFAGETSLTLSARLSPGYSGQAGDFQSSNY
ncbi:Zn-finger transcription factor [Aspergillus uvarum CBS 121591]|uniref:Zn-finger transcription factor n=1 Tax=Aspergillus uvarum CBS 121591 TaxID=1448315 RepID=A0A319C0G4_9EURO|nr:Zn-finger transcription factor [Aspergillus uvarum CBS 121591]PYH77757.1 Zn-finger transcription factor [Aspergillus uvarum CBS 121591]